MRHWAFLAVKSRKFSSCLFNFINANLNPLATAINYFEVKLSKLNQKYGQNNELC